MPDLPLVSCIMPTTADRERFVRESRACFDAQTYPNRELVVVDGPGCVGVKRNQAVKLAKGRIVAHWDDDDWSHPDRLRDQVDRLMASEARITGYSSMYFRDEIRGGWWIYRAHRKGFILGTSLVYWRDAWAMRPFKPFQIGEDRHFWEGRQTETADAEGMMWARIHAGNTSKKTVNKSNWTRIEGTPPCFAGL